MRTVFPFGLEDLGEKHRQMLDQGLDLQKITTTTGTDSKEQTPNTKKCFMCKMAIIEYFYNGEKSEIQHSIGKG